MCFEGKASTLKSERALSHLKREAWRYENQDLSLRYLSRNPLNHFLLDLPYGFGRIKSFGAGACTVHNRMAAIEFKRIFQVIKSFPCRFISAIGNPSVGLEQRG